MLWPAMAFKDREASPEASLEEMASMAQSSWGLRSLGGSAMAAMALKDREALSVRPGQPGQRSVRPGQMEDCWLVLLVTSNE